MATLASSRTSAPAPPRNGARESGVGPVAAWLFACCALVFAMVVVGGVTRLTHSGLSITEWQPIVGTLPPLDDASWQAAFAKYRATPEYLQVNRGMTLAQFKVAAEAAEVDMPQLLKNIEEGFKRFANVQKK